MILIVSSVSAGSSIFIYSLWVSPFVDGKHIYGIIYLSIHLSIHPSHLSIYPFIHQFIPHIYLSIHPSIQPSHLSVHSSINSSLTSIYPFIHQFIHHFHLSIYLSFIYLFNHTCYNYFLQACAPLWQYVKKDKGLLFPQPRGRCVYSNRTLTDFLILFPCNGKNI